VGQIVNPSSNYGTKNVVLQKIRASIATAQLGNPVESLPWLPPQLIAGGNAVRGNVATYPQRMVVTNAAGTHMFVATGGGVTAAAEPATMTNPIVNAAPYNLGNIVDGTVNWAWLGAVRVSAAQIGAPTISVGALPAQLTTNNRFAPNVVNQPPDPRYFFTGGQGAISGNPISGQTFIIGSSQPTFNAQLNGNFASCGYCNGAEFVTDAQLIAFDLTGTGNQAAGWQLQIEIDGRRLCDGGLIATSTIGNGLGYVILDWRSQVRKNRKIRLSTFFTNVGGQPGFNNFFTTPQDSIYPSTNADRWALTVLGDSLINQSNSGPFIPRADRVSILADLLGCDNAASFGVGGTGFIANAAGLQFTYQQRIPDIAATKADVVYIPGALNDGGNIATLPAAVTLFCQTLRQSLPNAILLMGGTLGGLNNPNNQLIDAAILSGVQSFNDANTFFVPVSTANPPFIQGTNAIQGAPTGSGNSEIYIGTTDITHLSSQGIQYAAYRDAAALKSILAGIPR
jgi:hypothetical protein